MLIEFPVMVEANDNSGLVYEAPAMFKIDAIEAIMMGSDESICDLHTNGAIFKLHMNYDKAIKYWNSALETKSGIFIARIKERKEPEEKK